MPSRKTKICVVTGSRADYGLLKFLIKSISKIFKLQLIVTGSHLSEEFGNTYKEILEDGLHIDAKVNIEAQGGTPADTANSVALAIDGFTKSFLDLQPDLVVILGDRYELLGVAMAAMFQNLPIAHFHGGETTEGTLDDSIRHALTKLSHLHFVASEIYAKRVIQLGEDPKNVHVIGGLGVDAVRRLKLLSRAEIESNLGLKFWNKNLLVTFHPITIDRQSSKEQIDQLLASLASHEDKQLIFTMPNADTDGKEFFNLIENFSRKRKNAVIFKSLGQLRYFSCIVQVDGVIGNSSSGILEVPTFKKPTINIGDRQKGRLRASSVIDCNPIKEEIEAAIKKIYDADFRKVISETNNPYGDGFAVEKAISILESVSYTNLHKKIFYNII